MSLFENNKEKDPHEFERKALEEVEKMLPDERKEAAKLMTKITNELMEKTQRCRMLEKELKNAVQRKKATADPILGKVCMVMFSQPKVEGAKVRMHVADACPTTEAIKALKNLIRDRENKYIGCYFMLSMKGREDALSRLEINLEAAWHLFQKLDEDLKVNDVKSKPAEGQG
jgi:hypothetical protein